MFNEANVYLRAFSQVQHCKLTRFNSSANESGSGGDSFDEFYLV